MFTFEDAMQHALDYVGSGPATSDLSSREAKRSVMNAYRDIANEHNWTYLLANGRINLNAAFNEGTVTYDADTLTWTVSGASALPDWTGAGSIRVGEVIYKVHARLSATQFTTYAGLSPIGDLTDATSYTLYQDTYVLPADFAAGDQLLYQRNFGPMVYVHPSQWLLDHRFTNQVGECKWYTITGDTKYPGRMVVRVFPYPGEAVTIDFVYRRTPRTLFYPSVSDGLISSVASSSSLTVTGSGNASSSLVGAVVRLSSNTKSLPTSPMGINPAIYEGIVTNYAAGVYTVDQEVSFTASGLRYTISDPIDLEEDSMLTAFLRGIEKQMSMQRIMKDKPSAKNQYEEALRKAKAADSKSFAGRTVGQSYNIYRQRLARMPMSFQ